MKNQLIGICFVTVTVAALAQADKTELPSKTSRTKSQLEKAVTKQHSKSVSTQSVAAAPITPAPSGPTGIGSIKLGITKEAVLALSPDEPVRIIGELTPKVEKTAPPSGTERFEGKISVPLSTDPVAVKLTFQDGLLRYISLTADGEAVLLERLVKQVTERYGPGKVEDSRKDEQCIYRNGNNFTIKSGTVSTSWTTPTDNGKVAITKYTDMEINVCPSNLRYGSTGGLKIKFFGIEAIEKGAAEPKKNLF